MEWRDAPASDLPRQVGVRLSRAAAPAKPEDDGSDSVVTTGSTLLDLAISGGRFERGGVPGGILVEIFGPSGCGKTVMLCEMAGGVQRAGGKVLFRDPEGRLNKTFAGLFGFDTDAADYGMQDTVTELFEPIRTWDPKPHGVVHGVFADSLAALSTKMEMGSDDGDKMGMRRAKEFSEECRKVCRVLTRNNVLMACSNQVRQNVDAGPYQEKYSTPGGMAIGYYSSLRLRCYSPTKIQWEKPVGKGKQKRVVGVETTVEVYKSSVWKPHHRAPVYILYDYGIDDIRGNLTFLKASTGASRYEIGSTALGQGIEDAIEQVEKDGLEEKLKTEVIGLWREIEKKFEIPRVTKRRV